MYKLRVAIIPNIITCSILLISTINITQAHSASPTILQVTTPLDFVAEDGLCSLREAILSANQDQAVGGCQAGSGIDTIFIPTGVYSISIPGPDEDDGLTGDLDITQGVTIRGEGSASTILDGAGLDRLLHINDANISAVVYDLAIHNGLLDPDDLLGGGGILSQGNLTLERVEIAHNSALRGGGVRNSQGVLNIIDSQILENIAYSEGGGIYGDGKINIARSNILANQAEIGGGVNSDETLTLTDVYVAQNEAAFLGGGLFNDTTSTIQRVLFHANYAPHGGGIYNNHVLSLTNVTLSGNVSERGNNLVARGGAIYNTAQLELSHTTLYSNIAEQGGNLYNAEGGSITLEASILAFSQGGNCINFDALISLGYNISDDGLCNLNGIGDRANTNPRLSPLADHLGFTQTHALLLTSPALDNAAQETCPTTDQRGVIRAIDGDRDGQVACDIGAYEHAPGGILYFEPAEQQIDENTGSIDLWVSRYAGDGVVSVNYRGMTNSASLGNDFQIDPGSLSWTSSDHSAKTITVQILEDEYREGDETGLIYLLDPTGQAGLLAPKERFNLIILANDPEGPPQPGGPVFLPLLKH